jgi:hypothetical protein
MKWFPPVISFLNSIVLFVIEDLGVQIEEPLPILPLASSIQSSGQARPYKKQALLGLKE